MDLARPLSVLVTRAKGDETEFICLLTKAGFKAIHFPVLQFTPLSISPETEKLFFSLSEDDWFVFTSTHAVSFFFSCLAKKELLNSVKIVSVGKKTEKALNQHGLRSVFHPEKFSAEELLRFFQGVKRGRIFLPQSDIALDLLKKGLENMEFVIFPFIIYKTEPTREKLKKELLEKVEILSFTSPSSVKYFCQLSENCDVFEKTCLCIGKTTAKEAEKSGFKKLLVPEVHTIEGMTEELLSYCNALN